MPCIYWKKKASHIACTNDIPYKSLVHEFGLDGGNKTVHVQDTDNTIIHGEVSAAVKRLLPKYHHSLDCIYYFIHPNTYSHIDQQKLDQLIFMMNALLNEDGLLVIYIADEIAEVLVQSINSIGFLPNKEELIDELKKCFQNPFCKILFNYTGHLKKVKDLIHLNQLSNGQRSFIIIEPLSYERETVIKKLIHTISDANLLELSLNYYTMGGPLFCGENQLLLNQELTVKQIREYIWFTETGTDYYKHPFIVDEPYLLGIKDDIAYYCFLESGANTVLDEVSLATIKPIAQQFIVYANDCTLPNNTLQLKNVLYKKIPEDMIRI